VLCLVYILFIVHINSNIHYFTNVVVKSPGSLSAMTVLCRSWFLIFHLTAFTLAILAASQTEWTCSSPETDGSFIVSSDCQVNCVDSYGYACPVNIFSGDLTISGLGNRPSISNYDSTSDNIFYVIGYTLRLENVELKDQSSYTYSGDGEGKAIKIEGGSAIIKNCTFYNNHVAIYFDVQASGTYSLVVSDTIFKSNQHKSYYSGGSAVYAKRSSIGTALMNITNCVFKDNYADSYGGGGAVYISDITATFNNCTFNANYAAPSGSSETEGGGALKFKASSTAFSLAISRSLFKNNYIDTSYAMMASGGGAVLVDGTGTGAPVVITDCIFEGNYITGTTSYTSRGGAIFMRNVAANISRSAFKSNGGGDVDTGGAIYAYGAFCIFSECTFNSNYAYGGGALFIAGTPGLTAVNSSMFTLNRASSSKYDAYYSYNTYHFDSEYNSGGAIAIADFDMASSGSSMKVSQILTLYNTSFFKNCVASSSCSSGGSDGSEAGTGGAIRIFVYDQYSLVTANIENCTFEENGVPQIDPGCSGMSCYCSTSTACSTGGGAIHAYDYDSGGEEINIALSVTNSNFLKNGNLLLGPISSPSKGGGGAILITGLVNATIKGSLFRENRIDTDYNNYNFGGAIYIQAGKTLIVGSIFDDNSQDSGSLTLQNIYAATGISIILISNTFMQNELTSVSASFPLCSPNICNKQGGYPKGGVACKSRSNGVACIPCQPGYSLAVGDGMVCEACFPGRYSGRAAKVCPSCSAGQYQTEGAKASCFRCSAGKFGNISFMCFDVPPGSYAEHCIDSTSLEGCAVAAECPVGSSCAGFSSKPKTCTKGKYQSERGATKCIDCLPGTYGVNNGSTTCLGCSAGKFSNTNGEFECKVCPLGQISTGNETYCFQCSSGTYLDTNAKKCKRCPEGFFSDAGATTCTICPMGKFAKQDNDEQTSTGCYSCVAGKYSSVKGATNKSTCKNCTVGKFSTAVGAESNSSCNDCAPGTFNPSEGSSASSSCQECPAGKVSLQYGSIECKTCTDLDISGAPNTRKNDCSKCEAGLEINANANKCTPCPEGYYSESGSICVQCPAGKFTKQDKTYDQVSYQISTGCYSCVAGKYSSVKGATNKSTCKNCTVGKFSTAVGADSSSACNPCQAGRYNPVQSGDKITACVACPIGTVALTSGANACDICKVGRAPNDKANDCVPCFSGEYLDTSTGTCKMCNGGHACPRGSFDQSPCQPGKYAPTQSSECFNCDLGKYAHAWKQTACDLCPIGQYQDAKGQTSCLPCPKDTFSPSLGNIGPEKCTPCYKYVASTSTYGNVGQVSNKSCFCTQNSYPIFRGKLLAQCHPCPTGGRCEKPSTINTSGVSQWLKAIDGYWQAPGHWNVDPAASFTKCLSPNLCVSNSCVEGHIGVLCEECASGYGKQFDQCVQCDRDVMIFYSISICVALLFISILLYCCRKRTRKNRKLLVFWREFLMILKIDIDFVQVNSTLPHVFNVEWPQGIFDFWKVFGIFNVDLISITGATCLDGMNFIGDFLSTSLLPILAVAIGIYMWWRGTKVAKRRLKKGTKGQFREALCSASHEMFVMLDDDRNGMLDRKEVKSYFSEIGSGMDFLSGATEQKFSQYVSAHQNPKLVLKWWWNGRAKLRSLRATIFILLCLHTPVTKKVFQYFNCIEIHNRFFLYEDFTITCWKGEWLFFVPWVVMIGLVFAIGFPVLMAVYLHRHRTALHTAGVQAKIGFLYSSFVHGCEFWEIHEILRKSILTGVIIYFQDYPAFQTTAAIIICVVATATLNFFTPHKNKVIFWLVQISFIVTTFQYINVLILMVGVEDQENVGILIIALDIIFFASSLFCLFACIYLIWKRSEDTFQINRRSSMQIFRKNTNVDNFSSGYSIPEKGSEFIDNHQMHIEMIHTMHNDLASRNKYEKDLQFRQQSHRLQVTGRLVNRKMRPNDTRSVDNTKVTPSSIKKKKKTKKKDTHFNLHKAVRKGNLEAVQNLIGGGVDLHGRNKKGYHPLLIAAQKGHSNVIDALLRSGADIHQESEKGDSAIVVAVKRGRVGAVKMLIEHNADVNKLHNGDFSLLHIACAQGYFDIVQLLVSGGADPNRCGKFGVTPLMIAAQHGFDKGIRFLISSNVDINARLTGGDHAGGTACFCAVYSKNYESLTTLVKNGANVNIPTDDGRTPLHVARAKKLNEFVKLLLFATK
jgi:ankyrin repeat protein